VASLSKGQFQFSGTNGSFQHPSFDYSEHLSLTSSGEVEHGWGGVQRQRLGYGV
jgi:hypothetical protein